MNSRRTLIGSSIVPLRFAFFMWLVFTLEFAYGLNLQFFALIPRDFHGLIGIVTAPFFHADPVHIISNTVPFLFFSITLFTYYPKVAKRVFLGCYLLTGVLVWLFARPVAHIGASGVVYALATFVIAYGFYRRDFKSLLISSIAVILYGSIYYGVLPSGGRVSWESHLFGAVVGFLLARYYGVRYIKSPG